MHIGEIVASYYIELALVIITTGVGILWSKTKALHNGMKALLRNHIISAYNKGLDRGFITFEDRDNIQNMYINYKALGGNGNVTKVIDHVMNLPTREVIVDIKEKG